MVKRLSKKTPRKELPHNYRIIPARIASFSGKIVLWVALGLLIITNSMTHHASPPHPDYANINALLGAQSAPLHMQFARSYWQNKQTNDALREIALAKELSQGKSGEPEDVLGAATPTDILLTWENGPAVLRAQYDFWKMVIAEHPDYRDVYLTLAALATQLNQGEDARYFQQKAEELDPAALSKTR